MEPRHGSLLGVHRGGWHRLAYTEWGDTRNRHVVVCVHGLTRNSRDFDALARTLSSECRVVCLDVVGRGDSEWLEDKTGYGFGTYEPDVAALFARITAGDADPARTMIDWVGTSMGGLLGMTLAARAATPIRRLVINDIGPSVSSAALARVARSHAKAHAELATLEEVERQLRETYATFGPLDDAQWRILAQHGARRTERGTYRIACDPGVVAAPNAGEDPPAPLDLWRVWDRIRCPVLVLRGSRSDVLTADIALEMQSRGPGARVVEFANIGHAPWLMTPAQIAPVRDFLLEDALT